MKKIVRCLAVLLMVLITVSFGVGDTYAATRSEVDKKIKSIEAELPSLKKKMSEEKAKEKKESAGAKYIFLGSVISSNPLIIESKGLLGGTTYYWIEDGRYLENMLICVNGYVKPTGEYRYYNGYTCAVANSVKVSNNSSKYKKQIKNKQKELSVLKNAKKNYMKLMNTSLEVGKTKSVKAGWKYSGKYNDLTWTSSNKKIATVDQSGKVTGKKVGKATITAKCSVSGISKKCVVTVVEPTIKIKSIYSEPSEFVISYDEWKNRVYKVPLEIDPIKANENYSVVIKNDQNISLNEKESTYKTIAFNIDELGVSEVQLKTKSGVKHTLVFYVYGKDNLEVLEGRLAGQYSYGSDQDSFAYDAYAGFDERFKFYFNVNVTKDNIQLTYEKVGAVSQVSSDTLEIKMRREYDDNYDDYDYDDYDYDYEDYGYNIQSDNSIADTKLPLTVKMYVTKTSDGIKIKIVDNNDDTKIYDEKELKYFTAVG